MSDLYNSPEEFGFEIFDVLDDDHADYSFDTFLILKKKSDGRLFFATDSGCSCPSPFEDVTVKDLVEVRDLKEFEIKIDEWREDYSQMKCTVDRKQEAMQKVKGHLNALRKAVKKS